MEQGWLCSPHQLEDGEEDLNLTIFPLRAITLNRQQLQQEFWHLGPCSSSLGCLGSLKQKANSLAGSPCSLSDSYRDLIKQEFLGRG